ncbi:sensor histidine kinase [Solimonas soli]|uniref:sensor histidine kinase n=1 Tax=Solimonas soli TaxID=413479 RepID=UPI000480AC92|nr:ATP-binding protein [Solimonas soli]
MIGLALRITVLLVATLLLATMTIVGGFYLQHVSDSGLTAQTPIGGRLAAAVALLDADPAAAEQLLRAASSPDFDLSLRDGTLPDDRGDYPRLAELLQRRNAALRDRALRVTGGARTADGLHVEVGLRDGRVLDAAVRGATLRRTLGRPFLIAAILLVGVIGLAALWALRAQIRPLEALAREVERIGTPHPAAALPERGAREVRQLLVAFNRMRGRIEELLAARTRLLAAISHDLGTYLTRLRLRIELIADDEQRGRAERDLHEMQQLLRDTLALARSESIERVDGGVVDLAALARHETDEYRALGAAVTLSAPEHLHVDGDALGLGRVLHNLLDNALRYAGGAEVQLDADGAQARLSVIDHGPGIPAAERASVLEPFYRRDDARTLDSGGAGLGLAIVADIVRRHGGTLRLDDTPGGGLSVQILLPLARRGQ